MNVYFDQKRQEKLNEGGSRAHRWLKGSYDDAVQYYNFLEHPELIRTVLEDFQPFDHHKAIQTFYDLIEWLNSSESELETNDCAFEFEASKTEFMPDKLEAHGRVMVFMRDYMLNLNKQNADFIMNNLGNQLQQNDTEFEFGYIGFAFCPTLFNSLPEPYDQAPSGVLSIYFWAWGDTDEETFENLDRVFNNLTIALKKTNQLFSNALRKMN